jgi:hypothetical protein
MALAEAIVDLRQRTAPVVLARDRGLPVLEALAPLLPDGLRRGAVHTVDGGPGATVLALALPAAASVAGSWTAVVGAPSVGLLAGLELGIARERLLVVPEPPRESWATVVATLIDAVDIVLVGATRVAPGEARRLVARAREREAVLVALPERGRASWPGADVRLTVQRSSWIGPCELGAGRLVARRADVVMSGRGAAARERRATLWLPGADGTVQVCDG